MNTFLKIFAYTFDFFAALWGLTLICNFCLMLYKFSKALYIKAKNKYDEINNRPHKPFDWRDI
jgi:hypothetical protein